MKHAMLIMCAVVLSINIAPGQMYVRGGVGYGLSLGSMVIGTNTTYSYIYPYSGTSHSSSTSELVSGSFGRGMQISGAVGVTISNNLLAELGMQYNLGQSFDLTRSSSSTSYSSPTSALGSTSSGTTTYKGTMLAVVPSLLVYTDLSDFSPFVRMGLSLSFPKLTVDHSSTTVNTSGMNSSSAGKDELSGNMALGVTGGCGIMLKSSADLNFIAELTFANISWGPGQDAWTSTSTSGTTVTNSEGTVQYSDNMSTDSSSPPSPSGTTALRPRYPFGFLGLNVGIIYNIR